MNIRNWLLAGTALTASWAFGTVMRSVDAKAGKQIPLCMIGDSITWYGQGDEFRKNLIAQIPDLAFVGTHTAKDGYSHAGEGGNSTPQVKARLDNPERVPECANYHLLIGINDSAAAKTDADVPTVAASTATKIEELVGMLLARPSTKKVFLGSILPGAFDTARTPWAETPRGRAGSAANALLRTWLATYAKRDQVVWVEYENALRAADKYDTWRTKTCLGDGLHPTAAGYVELADILAPVLRANAIADDETPGARCGVRVENRWVKAAACSKPLIPGWYVLSFRPDRPTGGSVKFRLYTEATNASLRFDKTYTLPVGSGRRCEQEFMTEYEGYGYTELPFKIELLEGAEDLVDIQIEKMRPSRKASVYGEGAFIDSASPISDGERIEW